MKSFFNTSKVGVCALILLSFAACETNAPLAPNPTDAVSTANARSGYSDRDAIFFALSEGTQLDKLDVSGDVLKSVSLTGLQGGERVLAIDFRPATGQLYGLGSTSRLYVINPETGVARMIGMGAFSTALSGTIAGFDFNPTVDRIRVVTNQGQNLRLNPETGTVVGVDGPINGPANAMIAAVAYTNNVAGATTTVLYDIDPVARKLYRQDPPNNGTLVEVGSLRINITGEGGFDIAATNDIALGLFEVSGRTTLFTVNLRTGTARPVARYVKKYTAIAIPTQPVAYAVTADNNLLIFNPFNSSDKYADVDKKDKDNDEYTWNGNPNDNNGKYGDGWRFGNSNTVVSKPIVGLGAGETVLGIDFRPLNGQLYASGSTSSIYTVNTATGAATKVGTLSASLSGTQFGFDFNPLVDRIRIVSNAGQNLRFNPNDGTTIADGMLNPATTGVTAAAYTNNFAGTTSTMLFDIDVNTDKLYLQNPPNNGTLTEIGSLGVNVEAANGFDIGGASNVAYALLTSGGTTKLYRINTGTGEAKALDTFGASVNGFAIGLGF